MTQPSTEVADRPDVRVGGARSTFEEARSRLERMLTSPSEHHSYPAYDAYPGGPDEALSEVDLLAPVLLGVPLPGVEAYDGLVASLPRLNATLGAIPVQTSLAGATYDDMRTVLDVYAFLDTHPVPGVGLTIFSAILHRKRPRLFPLFDAQIAHCYLEADGAPLRPDDRRSYTGFAQLWLRAVQRDLDSQLDVWAEFTTLVPAGGPQISALRALHVVGSTARVAEHPSTIL